MLTLFGLLLMGFAGGLVGSLIIFIVTKNRPLAIKWLLFGGACFILFLIASIVYSHLAV